MTVRTPLFTFPLVLIMAGGCKSQDRIVGSWQATTPGLAGISQQLTWAIAGDGTYKEDIVSSRPGSPARLISHDTGTWKKLGPDKYEFMVTDTDWVTEGGSPIMAKKARERFQARKATIIANANKEPQISTAFDGNDKFSFSQQGVTVTFSRNK